MLRDYQIIDADGHVVEPEGLWEERVEPSLLTLIPEDCAPGMSILNDVFHDPPAPSPALADVRGRMELHYKEYRDAGWSPESQVKAMDRMGIDMAFLYPSVGLFKWSFNIPA